MNKDLEKSGSQGLQSSNFPEELKPFERGVGPAVAVGKATGNFVSNLIDGIVDLFCDDDKDRE